MRRQSQCKKTKTENNPQYPAVPLDLQIEILTRLPVKSIDKFLVVSKSWETIIRSKSFISLFHFLSLTQPSGFLIVSSYQNNQTGHINYYFVSRSSTSSSSSRIITGHSQNQNQNQNQNPRLNYPYYVNGLMNIGEIICNPCTGKFITLPSILNFSCTPYLKRFFGYDPINDHYKVLTMTQRTKSSSWPDHFQVFTLGAKPAELWRTIDCSIPHRPRSKGLCIDGAIYYIAKTSTGKKVVRFDLKSEKFDIFATLSDDVKVFWHGEFPTLINYYGKLATPIKISETRIDLRVFQAGKQDFLELELSFDNLPEPCLNMKGINHLGELIFAFCTSKVTYVTRYDRKKGASFKRMILILVNDPSNLGNFFLEANYFMDYVESVMLL